MPRAACGKARRIRRQLRKIGGCELPHPAAAAFSRTRSTREVFGIVNTFGCRVTQLSTTWRGVRLCRPATSASARLPLLAGHGKLLWSNGE